MLAAVLFGYLSLVQLGYTGDYAVPDLGSAAVNAFGSVLGLAIGGWLIRRASAPALAISVACAGTVVAAGGYQLTQGIGGGTPAFAVAAAGLAGLLSALALGRLGRSTAEGTVGGIHAMPDGVDARSTSGAGGSLPESAQSTGAALAQVPDPAHPAMGRARRVSVIGGRSVSPSLVLTLACAAVALVALVELAVRSALTLNIRWDTFMYHLPFAALRGGLSIPYDMNDTMRPFFEGFPPLPDLVQGLLWRLTGSVNATGVVNFIAFGMFLVYSHKVLRAPFWLVALISLTAPMVLIHTTVSYVDLFGNAFLAIGVSSCLYAYLVPEKSSRAVVVGGLAALAAASWSKFLLVPVVGVMFILFAAIVLRSRAADRFNRRQAAVVILVFATLAAAPYVKNLAVYGNPFWPTRVPIAGTLFPYVNDDSTAASDRERPAALKDAPQAQVFVQSLFEINVPTSYPNRARWIIDQGDSSVAFRMGGFWGAGVVIYLLVTFGMLIAYRRRAGIVASVAGIGLLCFVAVLPVSNELRYYMFIPLTWAATIGMLYPHLRERFPHAALGLLGLVLVLFGYIVSENLTYYQIQNFDYRDAAVAWGAADWWPKLQPGKTYCVVDMLPIGIMMTGPTMHEFSIVDRTRVSLCPVGTIVVTTAGIQGPYLP
jgi:hypothetical protein